jgi:hypothetical protein
MNEELVRVVVFNCEWRKSASSDAAYIRDLVTAGVPDIVCLTEVYRDFFAGAGHTIEASADYGYPLVDDRRKVVLWSRQPWTDVDTFGPTGLPEGRFVKGRTQTAVGEITVVGVCIPWARAHVDSGHRNREPWEDHLTFLTELDRWLPPVPERMLIVGDFNQRVPRKRQPQSIYDAMTAALLTRFEIATAGNIQPMDRQAIDHLCHSRDFTVDEVIGLSNIAPSGRLVSDHFGAEILLRGQVL